jgi:hypothetical protein
MTPVLWNEAPVSLDKLDDHLKAMLRLKIREFVHLSPLFKNVSSLDPTSCVNDGAGRVSPNLSDADCPNRPVRLAVRRMPRPHAAAGRI